MMLLCCIPMLVIAVVLVASGVVSAGFLITAGGCTAMMFVMMRMMPGHWRDDCHAARRTPLSYPDAVVCDSSERSRRDAPPRNSARARPAWRNVLGALILCAALTIAILNELRVLPGGHNELYLVSSAAVGGFGIWWLDWLHQSD